MGKKQFTIEQIISKLREAEISLSKGSTIAAVCRSLGIKVPQRQPKRKRLWLNDGSCVRLRPCRSNHVWSYDFVADRTMEGLPLKMLTILDEYSRECLAIDAGRSLQSIEVLERLAELFL